MDKARPGSYTEMQVEVWLAVSDTVRKQENGQDRQQAQGTPAPASWLTCPQEPVMTPRCQPTLLRKRRGW